MSYSDRGTDMTKQIVAFRAILRTRLKMLIASRKLKMTWYGIFLRRRFILTAKPYAGCLLNVCFCDFHSVYSYIQHNDILSCTWITLAMANKILAIRMWRVIIQCAKEFQLVIFGWKFFKTNILLPRTLFFLMWWQCAWLLRWNGLHSY
jgi:hypothetical protein